MKSYNGYEKIEIEGIKIRLHRGEIIPDSIRGGNSQQEVLFQYFFLQNY